jgi:TonB family protein
MTITCRSPALILLCAFAFTSVAISEGTPTRQAGGSTPNNSDISGGIVMLSDPEGLDWNEYIRNVYVAIRKKFTTTELPDSAKKGEKGTVRVEFQIRRDGQVPEDSLFLIGSRNKDMDDFCLGAIKAAAPFQHLPEEYRGSSIKLRETFYFNVPKSERSQNW